MSVSRRYLAVAAALVMALSGCTKTSDTSSESSPAETSPASTAQTEKSEETTAPAETEAPVESYEEQAAEPAVSYNDKEITFSHDSGVYAEDFELEIKGSGGKLLYTIDGSDPAVSDTAMEYSAPVQISDRRGEANVVSAVGPELISGNFMEYDRRAKEFKPTVSLPGDEDVDKCTVIRAAEVSEDGTVTRTFSRTYFIGTAEEHIQGLAESCEAMGTDLAVISISMDYDDLFDSERGIYVRGDIFDKEFEELSSGRNKIDSETARSLDANYKQRGRDWERQCSMELLEFGTDGAEAKLSQVCGIRIQGNYSRSDWQKGFRLFARNDYGDNKFRYTVFGEDLKDDSGQVIDKFKTLELRAGGNCAFTAKFNDIYWQEMSESLACDTKASRPCVVYLNGEYWGLYILEEDYSENYFEDHHGVDQDQVVIYKGDAEKYASGYKLDEGTLPEGETNESYFFNELKDFFRSHRTLQDQADYDEFSKLVDIDSCRDYFLAEIWINNKWDWPGKNWSMWKTAEVDPTVPYADGRWRFIFYDMEFGGVSGQSDAYTNTVKEDNYKPQGLLDMDTNNPAVLSFALLMTNEGFREDFNRRLNDLSDGIYEKAHAEEVLDSYIAEYSPLYDQFFARYPGAGSKDEALNGGYASAKCIRDFLEKRADNISRMTDWIDSQF